MKFASRYPNLKSFGIKEQHLFFGRSADIKALYDLVSIEKTVLFYSKSGLGKTSLINAGLIPKLKQDDQFRYNPFIIRLGIYSEGNNISPKEKIIEILQNAASDSFLKDFPELYENTLAFWLKSMQCKDPEQTQVLIFDQFEELFSYPDDQVKELKKELHELLYLKASAHLREKIMLLSETKPKAFSKERMNTLTSAVNIRMLFVIRSDYVSMLNRLTDLLPNLQRTIYELTPLPYEGAYDAIIKPSSIEGDFLSPKFEFSKEAVHKILAYLSKNGKEAIEPFQLQLVCQYAENLILKNQLKHIIYPDDLGDIKDIHESFYDNLMAELPTESDEEKRNLHSLLEGKFIYEPEKRRLPVLKGMILRYISERTLSVLEMTHLIRSEPYQDSFIYELSHDTLVEPILKSYHKRKKEEERLKDQELSIAPLQAYHDKAHLKRKTILIVLITIIFSIGSMIFGFIMWHKVGEQQMKIENLIQKYNIANEKLKVIDVEVLINEAKAYEKSGNIPDAERLLDSVLKIDITNQEAIELLQKYRNP